MKSVFKTVAPIAMTLTFALSGVAMADTAATAPASADTAKTQPEKPVVHHKHKAKTKAAASKTAPVTTEKSASTAAPAVSNKAVIASADTSKKVEPVKTK